MKEILITFFIALVVGSIYNGIDFKQLSSKEYDDIPKNTLLNNGNTYNNSQVGSNQVLAK